MPISLVVADDHPLILDGLQSLFRRETDFRVLAQCSDGAQALDAVKHHKPDILLLDLRMKDSDGLSVLRAITEEAMPTRVVVLTAGLDEDQVVEAIRLGAKAIVLKEMAPRVLVQCIREVRAGAEWQDNAQFGPARGRLSSPETDEREPGLTERERDVIRFVSKGLQNKDIAAELGITEGTVKIHVHRIYAKLGLSNRVELAVYARGKGIIGG